VPRNSLFSFDNWSNFEKLTMVDFLVASLHKQAQVSRLRTVDCFFFILPIGPFLSHHVNAIPHTRTFRSCYSSAQSLIITRIIISVHPP
jgi:hypothetical protein